MQSKRKGTAGNFMPVGNWSFIGFRLESPTHPSIGSTDSLHPPSLLKLWLAGPNAWLSGPQY